MTMTTAPLTDHLLAEPAAPAAIRRLTATFAGELYLPGDLEYDVLRRPLNPAVDPHPAAVAVAANATDVRAAVTAARRYDVPFAVQATGHGTHVGVDGGILLNTSRLAGVHVDPQRRVARVGAGARWGHVLAAAAPYGLAPLAGSAPSVGVVGFTLGGGVGWLSRRYGYAADSVIAAELVTADGQRVRATAGENPDLHWAIRGGGPNFGVVTALEFRLYPVDDVYGGVSYFAADRAVQTLARYREWIATIPDELSTALVVTQLPDADGVPAELRGRKFIAIKALYAGDAGAGRRLLEPLRQIAGPAVVDGYRAQPFSRLAMGGTPPRQLELVRKLDDVSIDAIVGAVGDPHSPVSAVEVRHWGGAIAAAGPDAGPIGHRDVPFSVIADARDDALVEALRPAATGGSFLNFLGDTARTATAYTPADLRCLAGVKAMWDRDNFFRAGHNIPPA
ncbi:MAG TPA: FAD-binding oxidoreductase [Solirubrobacterales bacterium]|nr:FAD-binding oxidoreductase [Solirubrobacterales bacterium]